MTITTLRHENPVKVIHCIRTPIGGLFRHICDQIEGQRALGLQVGLICDSTTGGSFADGTLDRIGPLCELKVQRTPMDRALHWSDLKVLGKIQKLISASAPTIIHGHGAKGGAFARLLAGRLGAKAIYTPHGGSLHYSAKTADGLMYLTLERYLKKRTDGMIFESKYTADAYTSKIGRISCPHQVIHNGLHSYEFAPVTCEKDCSDFVFIGEFRKLKGLDILLQATRILSERREISVLVAGSGPDAGFFKRRIHELGLENIVSLTPPIYPATKAFSQAQCVIVPSLSESFPYIVLEAAAARVPLIATRVGGIPEIFGPYADHLVTVNDPEALADAMLSVLTDPDGVRSFVQLLYNHVESRFRVKDMVQSTVSFYERVLLDA